MSIFLLKKIIAAVCMPLPIASIFFLAAFFFLLFRGFRKSIACFMAGALIVILSSFGPFADMILSPLEDKYPPMLDPKLYPETETVVVLGSGYRYKPGFPLTSYIDDSAMKRLAEGIVIYRQLPGRAKLVVSGGDAYGFGMMAALYQTTAAALGVPREDMFLLREPRVTADEAREVLKLLGSSTPFFLVTSASHMERAVRHFKRVGLNPIPAPTNYKSLSEDRNRLTYWFPSSRHLRKTERAVYEYMGLISLELDH